MFKCGVCGINATSEGDLQQHLRGRIHMVGMERYKEVERSIYVRGFPDTITTETLRSLLEKNVGGVKSVWMHSSMSYALIEFQEESGALKALQMPQIKVDGRKLVIKPRLHYPVKVNNKSTSNTATNNMATSSTATSNTATDSAPKKKKTEAPPILEAEELLKIPTLDGQLKHLSDLNKLPLSAIQDQLVVAFDILCEVRKSFPYCIVAPFGSVINSFATRHSDCDLTFLTRPSPQLVSLMTGNNYFSPQLLSFVERLEIEYDLKFCPPLAPPPLPSPIVLSSGDDDNMADISDLTGDSPSPAPSSSSSSSFTSLPRYLVSMMNKRVSYEFCKLCDDLMNMDACNRVQPVPHARTPIIQFIHKKTALHCDISIDAVLGPLNTRLMKSYCDFEPRLSVLMPVIKIWSRCQVDIPRQHFNSYALSLMVIYALQHASPPILPCLQQPDQWPRAVGVAGKKSHVENDLSGELTVWKTSFVSSSSLQHSLHPTSTTVGLLQQFFKFYAEEFDYYNHVISVSTNRILTRRDSEELARLGGQNVVGKRRYEVYNPLVVQDPFDLNHNVTRIMNSMEYKKLREFFKKANSILQIELEKKSGPVSILTLFDKATPTSSKTILLSQLDLSYLLSHDDYHPLIGHLSELDLNNADIKHNLGLVVMKELLQCLTLQFGFTVEADVVEATEKQEGGVPISHMTSSVKESMMVGVAEEEESDNRKRKRKSSSSCSNDGSGDGDGDDGVPKRTRKKRPKKKDNTSGPHVLDVLYSMVPPKPHPHSYTCTAFDNTWVHTRRARRKGLNKGSGQPPQTGASPSGAFSPLDDLLETLPPSPPSLQLQLKLLPPPILKDDKMCALRITRLEGTNSNFHTFIVVMKKILTASKE